MHQNNRGQGGEWKVDNDCSVSAQVIPGILGWYVSRFSLRLIPEWVRQDDWRNCASSCKGIPVCNLLHRIARQKPEHKHNGKTIETWYRYRFRCGCRLREPGWRDSCHRQQTSTVRWQTGSYDRVGQAIEINAYCFWLSLYTKTIGESLKLYPWVYCINNIFSPSYAWLRV